MKIAILTIMAGLLLFMPSLAAGDGEKPWTGEIEGGWVFSGYNDVRIPGDSGTLFSLSRDLEAESKLYYRLRLSRKLGRRHELSLLYAPLSLEARGNLPGPVFFAGTLFPAGAAVRGDYKFNSYRLTYRYRLLEKTRLRLDLGFTAKVRDAKIALDASGLQDAKTDLGFVPLLHLRLQWDWSSKLGLLLEADAAAAKQGRAEDVLLAVYWRFSPRAGLRLGYRFVEGGADVSSVYTFAYINYLAAGIFFSF